MLYTVSYYKTAVKYCITFLESDQNCSNPTPSNKFTHLMIKVYENSSKVRLFRNEL